MAISPLPSYNSLGLRSAPMSPRNFITATGSRISRTKADDLRAQSLGFKNIKAYNAAKQDEVRQAGLHLTQSDKYDITGKSRHHKELRQTVDFKMTKSDEVQMIQGGKKIYVKKLTIKYTGKQNIFKRSFIYDQLLKAKLDILQTRIIKESNNKVSRVYVEFEGPSGSGGYVSSTYVDLPAKIRRANNSFAQYIDSLLAAAGGYMQADEHITTIVIRVY